MSTHTHLNRQEVSPRDVEALREARTLIDQGSPVRLVLDDLLLVLCSIGYTGHEVRVDISTAKHDAPCSHPRTTRHQTGA